jgi:protein-disulfide isomerase
LSLETFSARRRLAEWHKELPVSLRDQIVLVYKYFPTSPNAWGLEAVQLAACVQTEAPDSFWSVFDYLHCEETISLANVRQQILNQTRLLAPAKAASVPTCYDDRKGAPIVQRDVALAASLHVTRTPTMFMNGRRVVPIFTKNALVELIIRAVDEHSTLAAQ